MKMHETLGHLTGGHKISKTIAEAKRLLAGLSVAALLSMSSAAGTILAYAAPSNQQGPTVDTDDATSLSQPDTTSQKDFSPLPMDTQPADTTERQLGLPPTAENNSTTAPIVPDTTGDDTTSTPDIPDTDTNTQDSNSTSTVPLKPSLDDGSQPNDGQTTTSVPEQQPHASAEDISGVNDRYSPDDQGATIDDPKVAAIRTEIAKLEDGDTKTSLTELLNTYDEAVAAVTYASEDSDLTSLLQTVREARDALDTAVKAAGIEVFEPTLSDEGAHAPLFEDLFKGQPGDIANAGATQNDSQDTSSDITTTDITDFFLPLGPTDTQASSAASQSS